MRAERESGKRRDGGGTADLRVMISLAGSLRKGKRLVNLHGFDGIESLVGIRDFQPSYIVTDHSLMSDANIPFLHESHTAIDTHGRSS